MAQIVYQEGGEGREHIYEGGSTSISGGQMSSMRTTKQADNRLLWYALIGLSVYYMGF